MTESISGALKPVLDNAFLTSRLSSTSFAFLNILPVTSSPNLSNSPFLKLPICSSFNPKLFK